MKRAKVFAAVAGLLAIISVPAILFAQLLGANPSFPLVVFENDPNGGAHYDAGTNVFTIDATAVALRPDPALPPRPMVGADRSLQITIIVDEFGALAGGIAGHDLIINGEVDVDNNGSIDFTSPLITGEAVQFGSLDSGGSTDQYDFRFAITGGSLASLYGSSAVYAVRVASENSTFVGSFQLTFGGRAKGSGGGECEDMRDPEVICSATPVCDDDDSDDDDSSSSDDSDNDSRSDDDDSSSGDNSDCESEDGSSDDGSSEDVNHVGQGGRGRAAKSDDRSSDDDSDDSSGDGDGNGGGLFIINFSASDDCFLASVDAVIDIGCDVIFVEDGQLIKIKCGCDDDDDGSSDDNSDRDFTSDDSDKSSDDESDDGCSDDDDSSSSDDSENDPVSDDDDSSSSDDSDGNGGACTYEFVDGVLVIHAETAVLIVTAVDGDGNISTCEIDLCLLNDDDDSSSSDDD